MALADGGGNGFIYLHARMQGMERGLKNYTSFMDSPYFVIVYIDIPWNFAVKTEKGYLESRCHARCTLVLSRYHFSG